MNDLEPNSEPSQWLWFGAALLAVTVIACGSRRVFPLKGACAPFGAFDDTTRGKIHGRACTRSCISLCDGADWRAGVGWFRGQRLDIGAELPQRQAGKEPPAACGRSKRRAAGMVSRRRELAQPRQLRSPRQRNYSQSATPIED